jgi:pilus assembly protein Flp/PilA
MNKFFAKITTWAMDDEGATAIEYGLIAAGVSIAIAVVVFTLGDDISATFGDVSTALQNRG